MTISELDHWRLKRPRKDKNGLLYYMSRFDALKELFGEDKAGIILQELSILTCCSQLKQ